MKKPLLIDVLVFTALIILGCAYPWFVKGTVWDNSMLWSFIVAVPIAVYFGLRKRKNWKKIFIGIPFQQHWRGFASLAALTWFPGQWHPITRFFHRLGCHGPAHAGSCFFAPMVQF